MSEPNGEWLIGTGNIIYELQDCPRESRSGKTYQSNRWTAQFNGVRGMPEAELRAVVQTMHASKDLLAACEMQAMSETRSQNRPVDGFEEFLALHGHDGKEPAVLFIRRFRDAAIAKAKS